MNNDLIARDVTASSNPEAPASRIDLPDATWDEGRLLTYMREHDRAVEGLERKSLRHEFCFGAAAQLKYEQLDGKWTQWAKNQGYPKETFRRRRLLFVRAGSIEALDKYDGKMEAYYDLGIYRRPPADDLVALDAEWAAKDGVLATDHGTEAIPTAHQDEDDASPTTTMDRAEAPPSVPEVNENLPPTLTGAKEGRPREVVLRDLEATYADDDDDDVENLQIPLPRKTRKVLDYLAAQEEADHSQVIARAVREYWLRHGDPTRVLADSRTIQVTA